MKQKILIFRAGPPIPIPQISEALRPHINDDRPLGIPMPGGVISIFETESPIENIATDLDEIGVFFFIFPLNSKEVTMPAQFITALQEKGIDILSTPSAPQTVELTVNEILDKINATGMDSLTEAEKLKLEQGS